MPRPTVIAIEGSSPDGSAVSSMLRTVLDGREPYAHVGVVGAYETFDGVEWRRDCDFAHELARASQHFVNAQRSGLSHLILEPADERDGRLASPSPAAHPVQAWDVRCALAHDGSGTVEGRGRALSFSPTSPQVDVGASHVTAGYGFIQLRAHTPSWTANVALPVAGRHNVGAALATIAVCEVLGVPEETVTEQLCLVRVPGHTELLLSPDQQVLALVEEDPRRAYRRRTLEAARREFAGFTIEVPTPSGLDRAVERAYGREDPTLVVLLGPARESADAFQAAVRRHAHWTGALR